MIYYIIVYDCVLRIYNVYNKTIDEDMCMQKQVYLN